jgi:hypothetical protein
MLPGWRWGPELLLAELGEQRLQGPIEDLLEIAVRNLMPQERLSLAQLRVQFGTRRKLHFVALRCEWTDHRPPRRRHRGQGGHRGYPSHRDGEQALARAVTP